jgi:HD-GYP domain-containing protein (c-di-GMP phosphodiesterase class II)
MAAPRKLLRRLRLRQLLFLLLLVSGIVPLAVSSLMLLKQNREILETQEKGYLTGSARFLSVELDSFLGSIRGELEQLGGSLLAAPPAGSSDAKLQEEWVRGHLREFLSRRPEMTALRVLQPDGFGPNLAPAQVEPEVEEASREAFAAASESGTPAYHFVRPAATGEALVVVAVRVGQAPQQLVVETVTRVRPLEEFFQQQAQGTVSVFLVDSDGGMLWFQGDDPALEAAVVRSPAVAELVSSPVTMTQEYELVTAGGSERMLGHVSPVEESGWGVVVQRPVAAAFTAVREMAWRTGISTAVLVAVALLIAALAARRVGHPIQQLAESTHEIAAGNFGQRVEVVAVGRELVELGQDFNRMSGHVQSYVGQLERAAQANRELFIGSMRAFTAAIDAKDPYTKGHSERVAAYSRVISKFLDLSAEVEHRVWVGALMHDVGKIGIEDRILKKGGVLSDDEYEVMKLHPAIGAQIMSRIEQLKEMLPAIRWHHEAWNGKGYPDGLRGEEIPLMARIVGIADTFDAITTNRPYQRAFEPDFAVKTITRLAGARFDAKIVTAFLRAFEAGQIQVLQRTPRSPERLRSAAAQA